MKIDDTARLTEAVEALSSRMMVLEVLLGALVQNPGIDRVVLSKDFDVMADGLDARVQSMPFSETQVAAVSKSIAEFRVTLLQGIASP